MEKGKPAGRKGYKYSNVKNPENMDMDFEKFEFDDGQVDDAAELH